MLHLEVEEEIKIIDKDTVYTFRAAAIEMVRRYDAVLFEDSNHTIPNKRELAEFRRWKAAKSGTQPSQPCAVLT